MPGVPIKWDDPSITYRETVTDESDIMCLSKSPNKHNRLFVKATPLDDELCKAIESGYIGQNQDLKIRGKRLEKEFGWDKTDTLKIWSFGPAPEEAGGSYGANVMVDQTKAVQYLNEIKESVNSGLLWASRQGVLAEENMRACRFNIFRCEVAHRFDPPGYGPDSTNSEACHVCICPDCEMPLPRAHLHLQHRCAC